MDSLEQYRNAKRGHIGSRQRKEAKRKREEVANDKVVTKAEFVFLTAERQEEELIKKIRTEKLKEELSEKSKRKTALTSEEYVKEKINVIIKYFRSKNDSDSKEIYFSDTEIRLMIFSYPTLINRTPEILDNKLNVITSYEEIDERTAYGMIKEFPAIMGFDTSRTKKQLDLLKREGLIDAIIDAPERLMYSVKFMYAQIQYAKERHHVLDLSAITRSNIFMCNSTLKRLYGVSRDDIMAQYPYIIEDEKDESFIVTPNEIAKASYRSRAQSEKAEDVLEQALQTKEKGTQ